MTDRRTTTRRTRDLVPEPLTRKRERRSDERRDSPRQAIALDVREPGRKSRSCMGDLSVGGASFITTTPPAGDSVELLFTIPTFTGPIIARAAVVGRQGLTRGVQVSVVFTELELEAELAIAQWFDDQWSGPVAAGGVGLSGAHEPDQRSGPVAAGGVGLSGAHEPDQRSGPVAAGGVGLSGAHEPDQQPPLVRGRELPQATA